MLSLREHQDTTLKDIVITSSHSVCRYVDYYEIFMVRNNFALFLKTLNRNTKKTKNIRFFQIKSERTQSIMKVEIQTKKKPDRSL